MLGNFNTEINMFVSFVFWFLLCLNFNVEPHEYAIRPGRIIGGEPATITDFPYQLAMEVFVPWYRNYTFFCGASIIHRSWAITAGHCVNMYPKWQKRLRSGSSYIMRGGTLHYAEKIFVHPEHYADKFIGVDYDVAIIKVSTPFHYSEVTQKISMACETPSPGVEAVVSGWGYVNEEKELPDQLQQLSVNIMEYEDCKICYTDLNASLTPRFLCASVPEGGKNIFHGDSGGPLVVGRILVGIASYFPETNFLYIPTAYTDVAKLRTWVTETIQQESVHH